MTPNTATARTSATLSAPDFDYLRTLVREKSAIVLEPGKEYLVESRLTPLVRREGLGSIADLVVRLRGQRPGALHAEVVDAMTTNETSFFRDVHPWDALKKTLLPELIEARSGVRQLNIWCAASSSGQEPYTLAMLLRESFPQVLSSWRVRILATDLSPTMVERGRAGIFSQLEVNRGLPAAYLVKYFDRHGIGWQLKSEIRSMVEFRTLNLNEVWTGLPVMDLVLIRNVLIYFDRETKRHILGRIQRQLRPDGVLMLGSSETTFNVDETWVNRVVGKTICYQAAQA